MAVEVLKGIPCERLFQWGNAWVLRTVLREVQNGLTELDQLPGKEECLLEQTNNVTMECGVCGG